MANNIICDVVGKDTVESKMPDGVMKMLTNVWRVPNWKKNLIFFGTLEVLGCKYIGENGIMKVSKSALAVMKACKFGSIYILQGSIITSSVAISLSSSLTDSDITKIWHMYLKHVNEKGLDILNKRELLCGQNIRFLKFCKYCVFEKLKKLVSVY